MAKLFNAPDIGKLVGDAANGVGNFFRKQSPSNIIQMAHNPIGYAIQNNPYVQTLQQQFGAAGDLVRQNNFSTPQFGGNTYNLMQKMVPFQQSGFTQQTVKPWATATYNNILPNGIGNLVKNDPLKQAEGLGRMGLGALSIYGVGKLTPATLAITGGLGAGLGALQGDAKGGFYNGLSRAPSIAGIGAFSNPLQSNIAARIGSYGNNPYLARGIQAVSTGLTSIPEGYLMNKAAGIEKYGAGDAAFDFAAGALTGGLQKPLSPEELQMIKKGLGAINNQGGFVRLGKDGEPLTIVKPDPFRKGRGPLPEPKEPDRIINSKAVNPEEGIYHNPSKIGTETLIESSGGWKPGMREKFDAALFNKDKVAVKQLLPDVPAEYRTRFSQEISEVMGGNGTAQTAKQAAGSTQTPGIFRNPLTTLENNVKRAEQTIAGEGGYAKLGEKAAKNADDSNPDEALKTRGFIDTVQNSPNTAKQVAEGVSGDYNPITNRETIANAQKLVKTDYSGSRLRVVNEPLSAETNAIGQEIMRKAQKAGNYDEAIDMAQTLAKKGTNAGQSVQAFSIWSKMTPEGMLRYATKTVNDGNEKMGPVSKTVRSVFGQKPTQLDAVDAERITKLMKLAQNADNDDDKAKYVKQVFETINKKTPWGVSDIVDEYRYNNMLSNPLTHLRNAISNLEQTFITRPATLAAKGDIGGAAKYEVGAIKSLPDAITAFKKGVSGEFPLEKLDELDVSKIQPKRLGNVFNLPTNALEASDRFFTTLVTGGELARGASKDEAAQKAAYTLFREDLNPADQGIVLNKIDQVTKASYQLRKVGLGWFIPFIRTPMNVAKQWIEYSPAGIATLPGAKDKKEQLAKAGIGSLVTLFGATMAMNNKTTWAVPTDPKAKELFYASGKKPFSVKVGDKWVPMQTFGVFAGALAMPAAFKHYQEDSRTALTDSQIEKLGQAAFAGLDFWSQQTFVSGLGSFVKTVQGDQDYSFKKNLAYMASQLKPWNGMLRYISTAVDPIFRKPAGFVDQLKSDIPFATYDIPAYTEPDGKPSMRNMTNYVAPYAAGQDKPEYDELYQMRNTQLQNNNVINKMKKDAEAAAAGDPPTPLDASAAEENSGGVTMGDYVSKQKAKFAEDVAKQKVEMHGEAQMANGKYFYQNDNGGVSTIDINKKIYEPKLSGLPELDKLEYAKESSSITAKRNDIMDLYRLGAITQEQAVTTIRGLDAYQKAIKAKGASFGPKKAKKGKAAPKMNLRIPKVGVKRQGASFRDYYNKNMARSRARKNLTYTPNLSKLNSQSKISGRTTTAA